MRATAAFSKAILSESNTVSRSLRACPRTLDRRRRYVPSGRLGCRERTQYPRQFAEAVMSTDRNLCDVIANRGGSFDEFAELVHGSSP